MPNNTVQVTQHFIQGFSAEPLLFTDKEQCYDYVDHIARDPSTALVECLNADGLLVTIKCGGKS